MEPRAITSFQCTICNKSEPKLCSHIPDFFMKSKNCPHVGSKFPKTDFSLCFSSLGNEHKKTWFPCAMATLRNSVFLDLITDGTAGTPFPGGDVGGDVAPFCVVEDLRLRLDGTAGVYDGVRRVHETRTFVNIHCKIQRDKKSSVINMDNVVGRPMTHTKSDFIKIVPWR